MVEGRFLHGGPVEARMLQSWSRHRSDESSAVGASSVGMAAINQSRETMADKLITKKIKLLAGCDVSCRGSFANVLQREA